MVQVSNLSICKSIKELYKAIPNQSKQIQKGTENLYLMDFRKFNLELDNEEIVWFTNELIKTLKGYKFSRVAFIVSNSKQSFYAYQIAMYLANSSLNIKCKIYNSLIDSFNWLYNSKTRRFLNHSLN